MQTSLPADALARYVARQLDAFFPDGRLDEHDLDRGVGLALERLAHCFERIGAKYYRRDGEAFYDHLQTDQHATFLYYLSHVLGLRIENRPLAAKVYALNKALHALDIYFEVELPSVFLLQHPVGSVLGRATYEDYLVVYQGVTVGSDLEGNYPELGEGVVLFGGSRVIGRSRLGSNTWVAPATTILDTSFPPDSVVFGAPPATDRRPTDRDVRRDVFGCTAERSEGTEG